MGAEIERIVDRKTIRGRVHYLVVWRGFGEESNTWESRMDLVADGYSSVIREYENGRKEGESEKTTPARSRSNSQSRSPSRGRGSRRSKSPGRSTTASTTSSSATPTRGRGRPPRSRSNSTTRSPGRPRRRSVSQSREDSAAATTTPTRRRSSRQQDKLAAELDEASLRATIAAIDAKTAAVAATSSSGAAPSTPTTRSSPRFHKAPPVVLAYEDHQAKSETVVNTGKAAAAAGSESPRAGAQRLSPTPKTTTSSSSEMAAVEATPGLGDLWSKLNESGWLLWFASALVVLASSLATSLVSRDSDLGVDAPGATMAASPEAGHWRMWVPVLSSIVALLLVFHQRDERASVKWVAIALSWRVAGEALKLSGEGLGELVYFSFAIAYAAILITMITIIRNDEHQQSKSTSVLMLVGALLLLLSDSWMVEDPTSETRVQLMCFASVAIAMSPKLTAAPSDE